MGNIGEVWEGLMPVMVVSLVQVAYAVMNILLKLAANDGANLRVLVAYRFIFATAFIAPLAFFIERKKRPRLTWLTVFQAFLCGLFGGLLNQNLFIESLALTSATYATAISNFIPAITFVLAICFRLERLGLRTLAGKAKVLGIAVGITGVMLLTFYKGAELKLWSTHIDLLHRSQQPTSHVKAPHEDDSGKTILGCLLALAACVSYGMWLIVQTKMSKRYPCHYSSTALMCLTGSIQCVILALCVDRDWKGWKLRPIGLLAALYTGIVTSGLAVVVISWCVVKRGPLFVTSFSPLAVLMVAIAGTLVLEEMLHVGSILGAALIIGGLYMVIWGKSKELRKARSTELAAVTGPKELEPVEIVTDGGLILNATVNGRLPENQQETKESTPAGKAYKLGD